MTITPAKAIAQRLPPVDVVVAMHTPVGRYQARFRLSGRRHTVVLWVPALGSSSFWAERKSGSACRPSSGRDVPLRPPDSPHSQGETSMFRFRTAALVALV